jgi:hypothetical protein
VDAHGKEKRVYDTDVVLAAAAQPRWESPSFEADPLQNQLTLRRLRGAIPDLAREVARLKAELVQGPLERAAAWTLKENFNDELVQPCTGMDLKQICFGTSSSCFHFVFACTHARTPLTLCALG